MNFGPRFIPTHPNVVELDRIGDEIAELSAHLDAATARLLELIREFDARGGWNNRHVSRARTGCAIASGSAWERRASVSASPGHWVTCRGWPRRSHTASCLIPRSEQ